MNADVDFGRTAGDYGRYRADFPDRFFDWLFTTGVVRSGDDVIDLGTGTGNPARGFALRGCNVVALDPSVALLDEARRIDAQKGVTMTRYVEGRAEELPFNDETFDVVIAGQCWHWFDHTRAASEARRVLKTGGRLIIAHFDWIPLPGNVIDSTERLILQHNPYWKMAGGTGIYPRYLGDVADAGFSDLETFSFDVHVPYTHEGWRGRVRASAGVAATLPPECVAEFDADLALMLERDFPDNPLSVRHRVWALIGRSP